MNNLVHSSNDEVVLISFAEKSSRQMYGHPSSSSTHHQHHNHEETINSQHALNYDSNNHQNSNANIDQQSNQPSEDYGSLLLTCNYMLMLSLMVFMIMVFFPKSLRRRLMGINGKKFDKLDNTSKKWIKTEGGLNDIGVNVMVGGNGVVGGTGRGEGLSRHTSILNNQKVNFYESKKEEYNQIYPNGDKCLIDDEFTTDEESNMDSKTAITTTTITTATNSKVKAINLKRQEDSNELSYSSPQSRLLSSRRANYGSSLPAINTSFKNTCSVKKAKPADNDDLSPLESVQNGNLFNTVFREKDINSMKTKPPKEKKDENRKKKITVKGSIHQNTVNSPKSKSLLPQSQATKPASNFDETPVKTPSSTATSDIFSIDSDLFSPQLETILDGMENNDQENRTSHPTIKDKKKNVNNILVERRDNNSNNRKIDNGTANIAVNNTPQSLISNSTNKSRNSTNMDFTPSPLSIFSKEHEQCQAVIILISSNIIFAEQHMQQQNAMMALLSKKFHLPVKVVDGNREKDRKRREELFRISGIRGQYPQIFFMDEKKRLTYFGNHVALDKLHMANSNKAGANGNSTQQVPAMILNGNVDGAIDASFFSI